MKLLIDENISQRLAASLSDCFPHSKRVRQIGLLGANDPELWNHAKAEGYCILTKDTDFQFRSLFEGHPPKVILLRLGNCTTNRIEILVRNSLKEIETFNVDPELAMLVIP